MFTGTRIATLTKCYTYESQTHTRNIMLGWCMWCYSNIYFCNMNVFEYNIFIYFQITLKIISIALVSYTSSTEGSTIKKAKINPKKTKKKTN